MFFLLSLALISLSLSLIAYRILFKKTVITPIWGDTTFTVKSNFGHDHPEAAAAVRRVLKELGDFGKFLKESSIKKTKKTPFKVKVTPGQVAGKTIFHVTVQGSNDRAMLSATEKYKTPRGFHWVVTEDQCVPLAFYKKFANDPDRTKKVTCPDKAEEIKFFLKWSGYLGLVGTVRLGEDIVLVTCSKNSVTNPYAKRLDAMVRKWMTWDLASYLADEHLSLAFEVMAKWDSTHGARVLRNAMVLTCVVSPDKKDDELRSYRPYYYPLEDVLGFAKEWGVPHTDLFIVRGKEECLRFSEMLHSIRDQADLDAFYAMCREIGVEILYGTVQHEDVLGSCLEGLVAHYNNADGLNLGTIKLKFVRYVVRTMALRQALNTVKKLRDANHELTARDLFVPENMQKMMKIITDTVPRWTTNSQDTAIWIHRVFVALNWCFEHWDEYHADKSEEKVAIHILAFEAFADAEMDGAPLSPIINEQEVASEKSPRFPERPPPGTMVFIVAPPGSGKSYLARFLHLAILFLKIMFSMFPGISITHRERDHHPKGGKGTKEFCAQLDKDCAQGVKLIIISMTNVYPHALKLAQSYGYQTVLVHPAESQEELVPVCYERVMTRKNHPTLKPSTSGIKEIIDGWWTEAYAQKAMLGHIDDEDIHRVLKMSFLSPSFPKDTLKALTPLLQTPKAVSPKPTGIGYFHLPLDPEMMKRLKALIGRQRLMQKGQTYAIHGVTLLHPTLFDKYPELYDLLLTQPEVVVHIEKIVVTPKGGVAKVRLEGPTGESLDHLVASGRPHITLWVSKGVEPVKMGPESQRTAEEEDVVEHEMEKLSFTAKAAIVWKR